MIKSIANVSLIADGRMSEASNASHLHQLSITTVSADLSEISTIFKKPSAYVEILVDGISQKKTQHVKHDAHPKWQETFTFLVTRDSVLLFRVNDHHTLLRDTVVGEAKINLSEILGKYDGKLDAVSLSLPLYPAPNSTTTYATGKVLVEVNDYFITFW
ncbi:hypothetical protein Anas_00882 [Armadillidium nasatum]|uniref:C2 domain-containing protein n=1 Tax=Armadillidium nasatum TaxID=96803 RepID=A0A5N5TH27_9CRUS|nr:hypothetical protein Anas_00882 [Armadillidium nasatum]